MPVLMAHGLDGRVVTEVLLALGECSLGDGCISSIMASFGDCSSMRWLIAVSILVD